MGRIMSGARSEPANYSDRTALASATLGAFGGSKRHLIKGRDITNATLARDSDRAVELIARHFTATARVPDQEQCRDDANDAGVPFVSQPPKSRSVQTIVVLAWRYTSAP